MGQNYSTIDSSDRKTIEYNIFDKSFELIEKYVKNTKGLRKEFTKEHGFAVNNNPNGYLNWYKVIPNHLKGTKGMAYLEAIKTVGQLLKTAQENHRRSGSSHDKHKFREVYELVDRLIDLRESELSPDLSCFCWIISKGDTYKSHEHVINAWNQFRH